jgi:hypothetical protein
MAVAAFAILVGIVIIQQVGREEGDYTLSEFQDVSSEQLREKIEWVFRESRLPKGEEVEFLTWLFEAHAQLADDVVRVYGRNVPGLARFMSETSWQLLEKQNTNAAVIVAGTAATTFPNNPEVQGIRGIINVLAGRQELALRFLEESALRQPDNPRVNFYLGGLLVMSEKISDRTRGKTLLMNVLESDADELSKLSGFILLSNLEIPLIESEIRQIFEKIEEADAFRTDNPDFNSDALRNILTRLVPVLPDDALNVADILLTLPESTRGDTFATIELAQQLGLTDKADDLLERLEVPEEEDGAIYRRFMRIQAVQLIAQEKFAEGIDIILRQTESDTQDYAALIQTMNQALNMDLPIAEEVRLLKGYLELPIEDPARSVAVLRRLVEIDPLREDQRIEYARTKLLQLDPILVGQWMMERGASEAVLEALRKEDGSLTESEYMVLIEASLANNALDQAQKFLEESRSQLSPTVSNFLQCRILSLQGEPDEAFHFWMLAHDSALMGNDYQLLKNLGFIALELNQRQNALQSMYNAFDSGIPFTIEQAQQLLQLTLEMGTLAQTLPVAEFLATRNPDNPTHQNNLAYFNFLAEKDVDASVDIMRELIDDYPDIYQFRLTLALGLIKAGRTNEASRLVQTTNINWQEAGTRGQMIYAVVLAATNQRVVAEGLVSNLDKSSLLPEERALLAEF